LYRLYEKKQIEIQPFFQRDSVWQAPDQTRFIDSLVKQLPIPSMCFAFDFNTRKWIVIDGLQRMTAIVKFLNPGKPWVMSKLQDVDPQLSGADTATLHDENSELYPLVERVENLTLPITILRCDFKNQNHMEYLFKIFHRLNTGGIRLNNQEVRNCIYSGPLNECLMQMDKLPSWTKFKSYLNGRKDRFRSVELVLRVLAFVSDRDPYRGNLTRFLNHFMFQNRYRAKEDLQGFQESFNRMAELLVNRILPLLEAGQRFGFTQAEALCVAILTNIDKVEKMTPATFTKRFQKFSNIELLSTEALSAGISRTESVKSRLQMAITCFK
jgi:hypothetical protein